MIGKKGKRKGKEEEKRERGREKGKRKRKGKGRGDISTSPSLAGKYRIPCQLISYSTHLCHSSTLRESDFL